MIRPLNTQSHREEGAFDKSMLGLGRTLPDGKRLKKHAGPKDAEPVLFNWKDDLRGTACCCMSDLN